MTDDERRRKAVILGLIELDGQRFRNDHGATPQDTFPNEWQVLEALGVLEDLGHETTRLTDKGVRHRDVLVQLFFSSSVRGLLREHNYGD